jgi:hypothetical protein
VQQEAEQRDWDPFTYVALVWHESRWRPGAVSRDGEDYGLGQIRARFYGACKTDEDPVNNPSSACLRSKQVLLDPATNLRMMAAQLSLWRRTCRKQTGKPALLARTLAGYGGYSKPSENLWCNLQKVKGKWVSQTVPKEVKRIIQYRRRLIRRVKRRSCKTK